MDKCLVFFISISMLCISMSGAGAFNIETNKEKETIAIEDYTETQYNFDKNLAQKFSKYLPQEQTQKNIELPWIKTNSGLLEWWVRLEYNGETFQQQVPISVNDFREKFLKHPEYGERLLFDLDNDGKNDVEVIIGFYWSTIRNPDGNDVKSLEKRFRVRQLETGGYIDDPDGELQVWSELHVNYGLFKKSSSSKNIDNPLIKNNKFLKRFNIFSSSILENFFLRIKEIFENIFSIFSFRNNENNQPLSSENDNDYISIGAGYRSEAGEHIPLYTEKRFAFARENIFSPTIFQHEMDPGSSKGNAPFELLYGFQSYKAGSSNPSYDVEFSVEFNPAVYLRTKFVPLGGHVYYYFEDESRTNQPTEITFAAGFNKKANPSEEGIELSLIFDKIDNSLGKTGRWMSFDIDSIDFGLLSGKFHYKSSHSFSVGVVVNSPSFLQKVELIGIPTSVDISWNIDFSLNIVPRLFAQANGFVDLFMSSSLGGINIYYPKSDPSANDEVFIDVPGGLPRSSRIDAAVALNADLNNLQDPSNYVYGRIKHTCSNSIQSIRAFLPEEDTPVVKVSNIPSYSEAKGKLNWNKLEGYAYAQRGSAASASPLELNIEYAGFKIRDVLSIRSGYIDTKFKVANDGYFYFDTSQKMFGNDLEVSNSVTGDFLSLSFDEVSANKLQADWNLDTTGTQLKINKLKFSGFVDILKGLEINLDYQGKVVDGTLDWVIAESGYFEIQVNQQADLILDFSDFAQNNNDFVIKGGITLSQTLKFDMSWRLKQGEKNGNVDPGYFKINNNVDTPNLKSFDFYITYQDKYGVDVEIENIYFYLILEWWKGDRLLPYIWLEYDLIYDQFQIDLLWTNRNGETQWYYDVGSW